MYSTLRKKKKKKKKKNLVDKLKYSQNVCFILDT